MIFLIFSNDHISFFWSFQCSELSGYLRTVVCGLFKSFLRKLLAFSEEFLVWNNLIGMRTEKECKDAS